MPDKEGSEVSGAMNASTVSSYYGLVKFAEMMGQGSVIDVCKLAGMLDEANAEIKELAIALDEKDRRNALFERCLDNALKRWQDAHPGADYWPDAAANLAWVFDRLTSLEMASEMASKYEWVILDETLESLPYEGQRVIVLFRHLDSGVANVGMAEYRKDTGAKWWYPSDDTSPSTHAYGRSTHQILAWTKTPGLPASLKVAGEAARKEKIRNCGHGATKMEKKSDGWYCSECGQLRAFLAEGE